ncbi:phosphotransferase family enzyme [Kribbella voronezhensis]|uniref:Phosphotransferase family enzyme n=1 Tax=Kribbella voronezhensis TaxID=2512212 RepID=A0A4R7TGT2_9ACTN|nr:phosphotransferase [Kribbella voronezhensis]TDU91522.1 phosphotransferase family enzyme [Kribbella voronezhensis]
MLPGWIDAVAEPVLAATQATSLPELKGELLREWGSSEVWRISFGLRSVIVKRGSDAQAGEASAYERFVVPLELPAPRLIHHATLDEAVVLVLADVGRVNLEQEPSADGFLAAIEVLAEIQSRPVAGESEFTADQLAELVGGIEPLRAELAAKVIATAVPALDRLHHETPAAVVHGDFVPKNLVTDGTRWAAVDWPLAYLAPHLSDLYTLVRDAVALGHQPDPIVAHYTEVSGADPDLVRRQVAVGGVCFITRALAWIVTEGTITVPPSKNWIAPLVTELDQQLDKLR